MRGGDVAQQNAIMKEVPAAGALFTCGTDQEGQKRVGNDALVVPSRNTRFLAHSHRPKCRPGVAATHPSRRSAGASINVCFRRRGGAPRRRLRSGVRPRSGCSQTLDGKNPRPCGIASVGRRALELSRIAQSFPLGAASKLRPRRGFLLDNIRSIFYLCSNIENSRTRRRPECPHPSPICPTQNPVTARSRRGAPLAGEVRAREADRRLSQPRRLDCRDCRAYRGTEKRMRALVKEISPAACPRRRRISSRCR